MLLCETKIVSWQIKNGRQLSLTTPYLLGGDKRDRTVDLLNGIKVLSQISYAAIRLKMYIVPIYFYVVIVVDNTRNLSFFCIRDS